MNTSTELLPNLDPRTERKLHRLERWMRILQNAKRTFIGLYGPSRGSGFNQERVNHWISRIDNRMNQAGDEIVALRGW